MLNSKNIFPKEWRCKLCKYNVLLGIVHQGGELVLKYKDYMAKITGTFTISINCRRCGGENIFNMNMSKNLIDMES